MIGIQTRGLRMEGAEETTEIWRPPHNTLCLDVNSYDLKMSTFMSHKSIKNQPSHYLFLSHHTRSISFTHTHTLTTHYICTYLLSKDWHTQTFLSLSFLKKMGQSRPLFVYFRSFHIPIQMSNIQFEQFKLKKA